MVMPTSWAEQWKLGSAVGYLSLITPSFLIGHIATPDTLIISLGRELEFKVIDTNGARHIDIIEQVPLYEREFYFNTLLNECTESTIIVTDTSWLTVRSINRLLKGMRDKRVLICVQQWADAGFIVNQIKSLILGPCDAINRDQNFFFMGLDLKHESLVLTYKHDESIDYRFIANFGSCEPFKAPINVRKNGI
jgi:hypothetical protein